MYKMVDPDNTTKFDARGLLRELKKFTSTSDPERVILNKDSGYSLLNDVLPQYIKETSERVKPTSDLIDLSAAPSLLRAGTTPDTVPYLTFNELRKFRTMLQNQSRRISRADPSSNAPYVMNDMIKHIEDTINTKMLEGPAEVAARFKEARKFASTEAYPRYRHGDGGTMLKEDPYTNIFKVRDDEIGPMFWKKGAKSSSLEEFNKIFSPDHPALREAIKDNAERADLADAASDLAMDSLKSYAMRNLQDALDKAPKSKPIDVLERWKVEYRDAIDAFPLVKDEVAKLERQYIDFADQKLKRTTKIEDLNKDIVRKYSGVEASTVVDDLLGDVSVEEVNRRVRDMYRAVLKEDGNVARSQAFDQLYPDTIHIDFSEPKLHAVRRALQESMSAELLRKSFDANTGFASGTKLRGLIHTNEDKLRLIYGGDKGMQNIYDVRDAMILMGTENKPLFQKDLNHIRSVMKAFGISPASILSRYYSASLGKVGPVYLVSDALTRLLTGVSDKHFDTAYRETMYNLDALGSVLKKVGEDDSAALIEKTRKTLLSKGAEGLAKLGRAGLSKFINEHTVLIYGREYEPPMDDDDLANQESGQLLNEWLEMNDQYTGQSSRTAVDLLDTGEDEEDDLEKLRKIFENGEFPEEGEDTMTNDIGLTDVELEQQQLGLNESPDDVEYVASVVQDIFEEAGLDPETGLIFAQLESSMGKFTRAPTSSAEGVFQFIDSTWESMIEKHGSKYGITMENADKFDPEQNAYMGAEFLKENAASLERKGHEATPENLYLAHFLGAGGANRFLKGLKEKPNAPVSKSVRKSQIEANKSLFIKKGKLVTLEEFMDTVSNKVDTARGNIQSYLDTGTSNTAEA
jgi:hypothetical protein